MRAVGDGVAKRDDGERTRPAGTSMPSKKYQEVKVVALASCCAAGESPSTTIVILVGEGVKRFGAHDLRRKIEANCYVGEGSDFDRHWVREHCSAGRNIH